MTLIATAYLPQCIVMGADTLLQRTLNYQSSKIIGYGTIQKLFYIQKTGTGISVRGRASWGEKSIQQILKDFAQTINSSISQSEVAVSLHTYVKKFYHNLETSYHLAGFQEYEPFVFDLDYDNGLNVVRENVNHKQCLRYSVLARVDDKEVRDQILPLPDFSKMHDSDAYEFLKKLFNMKVDVENKKPTPSVGYPIDYLFIYPKQQYRIISHKEASEFILDLK